jgi:hypothetical protein
MVNMYLMYLECWKKFPIGTRPMAHLQFRNNLYKAMTQGFHGRDGLGVLDYLMSPTFTSHHRQNIVGNALCTERGATTFVLSIIASSCAFHRVSLRGGISLVVEVLFFPPSCRIICLSFFFHLFRFFFLQNIECIIIIILNSIFWIFSIFQCVIKEHCIYFSFKLHILKQRKKKMYSQYSSRLWSKDRVCSREVLLP